MKKGPDMNKEMTYPADWTPEDIKSWEEHSRRTMEQMTWAVKPKYIAIPRELAGRILSALTWSTRLITETKPPVEDCGRPAPYDASQHYMFYESKAAANDLGILLAQNIECVKSS